MKILFVTTDRHAAQLGAQALQRMEPGGRFTWTKTPESAFRWLQANRDAAAIVMEAESQPEDRAAFREQVGALGLRTRIVVVPAGQMGAWLNASGGGPTRVASPIQSPGPDHDRGIHPAPVEARVAAPETKQVAAMARADKLTVALQRRLLELEASLDESRQTQKRQELAAADRLARRETDLSAAVARAATNQAAAEQRLADSMARSEQMRQRAEADLEAAALREGALKTQLGDVTAARETLQRNLATLEAAQVEADRRSATRVADAAARLADLQTRYDAVLAIHATARVKLEQQLSDADAARQQLVAEAGDAAAREGALQDRLAQEAAARQSVERNLAAAEVARTDAERRHGIEVAQAAAHLLDLQRAHDAAMAQHAAALSALDQQLAAAAAAKEALVSAAASAAARRAALEERLAQETHARERLEQSLAAAEAARTDVARRHDIELAQAAARLDDLQKAHDAALEGHAAARTGLEQQLADAAAATQALISEAAAAAAHRTSLEEELARETAARQTLEQNLAAAAAVQADTERRREIELAEAAARLADLQKAHDAALEDHAAARTALEQQLADASAAAQELTSEATAAAARQARLEEQLAQQTAARETLEQNLAAAGAALADAERRHGAELAEAAAQLTDLQTEHEAARTEHADARGAFERQLAEAAAAMQHLISEAAAASERETALTARLSEETTARQDVERALAAADAARADAERRHATELADAAARLADLQASSDAAAAAHGDARAAFEQQLAAAATDAAAAAEVRWNLEDRLVETRTQAAHARRRVLDLTLRRRRRSREQVAQLERQLTDERAEAQRALSAAAEELRLAEERYGDLQRTLTSEREEHERRQVASETELTRLNAEYDQARRSLDHLGISFAALERVATENAAERARLESVVADRDAQLRAQVERHVAAERAAAGTIETLRQELQAARSQAARLQEEAERAAVLQKQLDDSQKESRRLFEKAPYGLCRFMSDGAFIKANHSFARLLGYRKADDLRTTSLGSFFECVADLRWVLERAVGTAATKTIETALKTRSGRRVEVRLHALSHVDGTVDVGVQDLTAVRALEARLREAQRMEAVGRLASEVAVTCDMVLRDVTHGGRQWLAAIDSDQQLRDRGELLLDEVTRAAAFLKQFSVYGRKEIDALAPVSVQRVIRDLAPVLKRVAGDHIDWVVPKMSAPVEVDVDAERLERVLVNVASYARARMPQGGRVKIDVATTVLSRDFTARYPNVRPGPHVLITIAEVSGGRHRGRTDSDAEPSAALAAPRPTSDTTGVDLGALLALLGDCGGHLWIAAERSGNMTLKVHLPRRMPHDAADPAAPATRAQRVRQLAGWFRH